MPINGGAYAFPSLVTGGIQSFAVIGTGLSKPNCPTAGDLVEKIPSANNSLGLSPLDATTNLNDPDLLYQWSDAALEELQANGSDEDSARFAIACALGLLEDPLWFGTTGLPIRGNTPRHRALARLVVEDSFSGIYSLNWDALLERTLESVGLHEIKTTGEQPPKGRPGLITAYGRVITPQHQAKIANKQRVIPIFKPHGCVEELQQSGTTNIVFKITTADLDIQLPNTQNFIEGCVSMLAGGRPVLAIGWRASEKYLCQALNNAPPAVTQDAFILASRSWYADSHGPIANSRNTTKEKAHAPVAKDGCPTSDRLFPWIFSRFSLGKIAQASSPQAKPEIEAISAYLDAPNTALQPNSIVSWCDSWLTSWIRLCWQVGAMEGCDPQTNQEICQHEIPTSPPDIHIPLNGIAVIRKDLKAAGRLLSALTKVGHFEYETFPGAFWEPKALKLILPLPTWGDISKFNDLAGLKNLFTAMRQHGLGKVRKIHLLALAPEDAPPLDESARKKLAALVAKRMTHSHFAQADSLSWLDINTLQEALNA